MSAAPKVSIIIPTLHLSRPKNPKYFMFQKYTLAQVLADLAANVSIPHEIVVVCNGQDPALVELVRSHSAISKSCINNVNVGVSRAWNMGAMMAEGEALCFLNDDVQVGPGAVEALYDTLMGDPSIGEVGPKGAMWKGAAHERFPEPHEYGDVSAIAGFMFMMRSSTFAEIGPFDIEYTPAGFEEIDYSYRLRAKGYRCAVVPNLDVKHHERHGVSASRGRVDYLSKSVGTADLHERNKAYFQRKWSSQC